MPSSYQPHQRFTEADRDKIAGRLRDAFADGRLDQPEFTRRLDDLYGAQTYGQLEPLVRDLPPIRTYQTPAGVQNAQPAPAPGTFPERKKDNQPQKRDLQGLLGGFTGVVLVNVLIWFVIGVARGGDWPSFWPVWLLIPWALMGMGHLGKRR
ncbi:DUF1707 SHOCT-like domain-containing protein [Kribbella sp. CA-253562]|uniref:DUF1707 SHOCT-like domain-containing protein n=1 Tax=Kribbella sp. CA-253562 TaxID=3239942 RepID=UPI003D8D6006